MKAKFYLLFSAIMWGVNFYLLKVMLTEAGFIEAGFWRYLFAVLALLWYHRKALPDWTSFKTNSKGILIVGLGGLFCFNLLFFWGLHYTTIVNAALIISLSPVFTVLLSSLFLRARIRKTDMLGVLLGLSGVWYLLSKGDLFHMNLLPFSKGDIMISMAMLLSSFYHIWVQQYGNLSDGRHFTLLTNFICLIAFTVIVPFSATNWPVVHSGQFWLTAMLFGVAGTAITYELWNKGVQMAGAGKAVLFMNIVPLSTALISTLTGDRLAHFQIVSGVLILSGLLLTQLSKPARFIHDK